MKKLIAAIFATILLMPAICFAQVCETTIDGHAVCDFSITDWYGLLSEPALSPAGAGRTYFDTVDGKFKCSEDGGAYIDMCGGGGGSGDGDVVGPASSTDNALAQFDGTTGKLLKNSAYIPTTLGGNLINFANPSAIRFIRINADNSVDALSDSAFRTAIGAGTGDGDLLSTNNLSDLDNAGTARTNLGATTVGGNMFTLSNPSAIRFIRINTDNTVDALSDSDFRTAIGAGTGDGDVSGPGSSTDNAIASFDSTTGKVIKMPSASLDAKTQKIINVVDPTSDQDVATKKYVDDNAGGSGDVESVGDCTGGACYDGSSDGGTYMRLFNTLGYGQFTVSPLGENRTYTFGNTNLIFDQSVHVGSGPFFTLINLGDNDTTLSRLGAGRLGVEGKGVCLDDGTDCGAIPWKAGIAFENPTADDDFFFDEIAYGTVTVTSIYCKTLVGTVDLDVTVGGSAINGSDITCNTTGVLDDSLAGTTSGSVGDELKLAITSVASDPTYLMVVVNGTQLIQ